MASASSASVPDHIPDARAGSSDDSSDSEQERRTRSSSVEWRCLACWTGCPRPPVVVFPSKRALFKHLADQHADLQALWKHHGMIDHEYCLGCYPRREYTCLLRISFRILSLTYILLGFFLAGQRFRGIRHMMAHTLMRHPDRVKKMTKLLQGLSVRVRQAERRRQVWELEAEKLPPKKSKSRDD